MRNIILRDSDGKAVATGKLPRNWSEVPLSTFLAYEATKSEQRTTPAVLALLTGIDEELLRSDVSLCVPLWQALDWFRSTLPEEKKLDEFEHDGVTYRHVGGSGSSNLRRINAGQFEALSDFIAEHAQDPIQSAPALIAVLYAPAGAAQTPELVEQLAERFRSLAFSVAYPIIADFLRTGAAVAFSIRTYSDLLPKATALLQTLDETSRSSGVSSSYFRKSQNWLLRTWIRSVRRTL
ncbi:hypothetical protein [Hymenobacter fodinae]|uniref:Uncharacterized protein n=1 Tax=Hymenobacter fodinae TaxID=2510796 RepID=A0A4Z0P767_9BACT|nr:hypothetical protein [Hymenobacter fodinae]TGE08264.1 hypothetical protein EU556_11115 [Hymenobacter fodinae]